jgi:hypothetical protein
VIAAAALLVLPAAARADGDPASDVLLGQDVFFPYAPATSDGVARALLELTRRTRADGWPIKVAIIATPKDLGVWTSLFTAPQQYARLLGQELRHPRLLVVTPVGFGGQRLGDGVNRALAGLDPVEGGGDPLARQALTAVARLSAQDGHAVTMPRIDTSVLGRRPYREAATLHGGSPTPSAALPATRVNKNGGGSSWLIYVVPLAFVLAGLTVMTLREARSES